MFCGNFFVLGKKVEQNPDILKRIFDENHYIANHSDTHSYKDIYSSFENTLNEYDITEKKIKNVLGEGYNTRLFRFPGGFKGRSICWHKRRSKEKIK